jgi:hypothetical protein
MDLTTIIVAYISAIVIMILLFLALRAVMNWYFKINDRIDLQKEQNILLSKILKELQKDSVSENRNGFGTSKEDTPVFSKWKIEDEDLSDSEKSNVQSLLKTLQDGEVITKHLTNKKIEVMNSKNYENWKKQYGDNVLKLIVSKK